MRHITFIKSLENLPDSIFGRVLPVHELEALIGTTQPQEADDISTPGEKKGSEAPNRPFTIPGLPQESPVPAVEATPSIEATSAEESPTEPSQPIVSHMASLLEQAEVIARDLRPLAGPTPISHASAAAAAAPEPPVADSEQSSVAESTPDSIPQHDVPQDAPREVGSEPPAGEPPEASLESPRVTMRQANNLLAESRFEEALQAFLELSRES